MQRIYTYITSALVLLSALVLAGCEDRFDFGMDEIPEGYTDVDISVGYRAFTPALESGSRASGTAMKSINTLWLVIYDADGNFIEKRQITGFTCENDEKDRPDGKPSSEQQTGHTGFNLKLANGRYRIYTVANYDMGAVSNLDIDTPAKLRKLDLTYTPITTAANGTDNADANAQMLGWLVNGDRNTAYGKDAPIVKIGPAYRQFHSWLIRAASKLTIAFNTNNLRDEVTIYLKSVTIKDIPKHCYLGDENSPGEDGRTISSELTNSETIYFGNAKANQNGKEHHGLWKAIYSGDSIYGLYSDRHGMPAPGTSIADRMEREHQEDAPAIYFYENLQGVGDPSRPESDKRQDVTGNNAQVSFPDGVFEGDKAWKDTKLYGSYVEVEGYYVNVGEDRPGRGPIIYRFMLGKDVIRDFNAERNHHYRLTLNFNGYANDVDFHIDYREEAKPGVFGEDTAYVSYMYNQPSSTVVRATPRPGYELMQMQTLILDNEWRPDMTVKDDTKIRTNAECNKLYNTLAWTIQRNPKDKYYVSDAGGYIRPNYDLDWVDYNGVKHTEKVAYNVEFGFLSLREVTQQAVEMQGSASSGLTTSDATTALKKDFIGRMRRLYFLGHKTGVVEGVQGTKETTSKGYRRLTSDQIPKNDVIDKKVEDFIISRKTNNLTKVTDYVVIVPLYTRSLSLDSWAVYSGANADYKHHRYARIAVVSKFTKVDPNVAGPQTYEEVTRTVVLQSRRIDNPRAIYRRRTSKEPFNVRLCYNLLTNIEQFEAGVSDTKSIVYEPVISRGPWSATIERDPYGLVKLTGNGRTVTGEGNQITGRTNTEINFTYTPNVVPPVTQSYGAIITVRYHGNSCTHKIIVRQGYDAHTIGSGTARWSTFSVFDKDNLTVSPLALGSFFRRNSTLDYPIRESNNDRPGFGIGQNPGSKKFWVVGMDDIEWSQITASNYDEFGTEPFSNMRLYNVVLQDTRDYRVPKSSELPDIGIYKNRDLETQPTEESQKVEDIGMAFGICYADGATKTQLTTDAYNFTDPTNTVRDSHRGVRGVTVYSLSKGDNLFFSFGPLGHAHRGDNGVLRYGSVDFKLGNGSNEGVNDLRPMAYNLMYQSGGCYWLSTDNAENVAIDYNMGNYNASYAPRTIMYHSNLADALPIKPIVKE